MRWFVWLAALGLSASSAFAQMPAAEWTVMVYLNADNNLESFGITDFEEMARVGSSPKVNVVVQMDRTPGFSTKYGDWTQTLRFKVEKDMAPTPQNAVADMGELNMGDGQTLTDFVKWGMATYPAQKYMLIIWDHGDGWRLLNTVAVNLPPAQREQLRAFRVQQVGSLRELNVDIGRDVSVIPSDRAIPSPVRAASHDDTSGDKLYNRETAEALLKALGGKKLDVLGFDACLMGGVETAYAFRDVAKVFVGSEELEPGDGWDYSDWLAKLQAKPEMDGNALGATVVESYKTQYVQSDKATTLSAVDLSKISGVAQAVSATADALKASLGSDLPHVISARNACKEYAPGYGLHNIDWVCFTDALTALPVQNSVKLAAKQSASLLKDAVIANYAGAARTAGFGSNGLSLYFPANAARFKQDPDHEAYIKGANVVFPVEFVQQFSWSGFLAAYFLKVRN
jgi:hypothetical protein